MLLIAGLLVAMGFVVGYVEVHQKADRTLALRQGPPPAVALQDFNPGQNVGPAREVSVYAEADFTKLVVLTLRGSNPERRAVVVPLFSLSKPGAARIAAALDEPPLMRTEAGADSPLLPPTALGFLFQPLEPQARPPAPALLAARGFGRGAHGRVVKLSGESVDPGAFTLMVDGALAAMDLRLAGTFLAVDPFVEGREAALTAPPPSGSHRVLYWVAVVLALIAAAASLRPAREESAPRPGPGESGRELEFVKAHPKFAPIPTQRELQEAARARRPAPAPGLAAKLLGWTREALARPVRNRPPRREDEAP